MTTPRLKNGRNYRQQQKADKIQEALELLNQAAKDKQDEFYQALENKYVDIKTAFGDVTAAGKVAISEAKKKAEDALDSGQEIVRSKANEMNEKLHENPWFFLGGVALGCFLLGYNFHKNKSSNVNE